MKERLILMSGEMVRAILDGRKSQTRRIIPQQPTQKSKGWDGTECDESPYWTWRPRTDKGKCLGTTEQILKKTMIAICPYGQPGDRLWVKETFALEKRMIYYRSDSTELSIDWKVTHPDLLKQFEKREPGTIKKHSTPRPFENPPSKWKSGRFMPRWASRITLEISGVRVERLREISEADAIAEGVEPCEVMGCSRGYRDYQLAIGGCESAATSYRTLWESINGAGSWALNPWVWCITFKRKKR